MNISKASKDPRMIKALTGSSYQEFTNLLPSFEKALIEIKKENKNRKRGIGGGQKGHLKTTADKLFFILLYIKTYPTFDLLSFLSDKGRGRSCEAVHFYLRVLKKALGHELVLPERKIHSIEEFERLFPEVKDVFLDGTERRIQRPKKKKNQNKQYSGKKKTHTRKNVIMADENKKVLFLSKTKSGKRHDKKIYDKSILKIPENVAKWADTGFQGIAKFLENVVMPKKGTKKNPLTKEEKESNRIISSFRVVIEHAIGGVKRFRVLTDVLRNRIGIFDDLAMEVGCGMWNYHLRHTR